jgi:hypothetical protein
MADPVVGVYRFDVVAEGPEKWVTGVDGVMLAR